MAADVVYIIVYISSGDAAYLFPGQNNCRRLPKYQTWLRPKSSPAHGTSGLGRNGEGHGFSGPYCFSLFGNASPIIPIRRAALSPTFPFLSKGEVAPTMSDARLRVSAGREAPSVRDGTFGANLVKGTQNTGYLSRRNSRNRVHAQ